MNGNGDRPLLRGEEIVCVREKYFGAATLGWVLVVGLVTGVGVASEHGGEWTIVGHARHPETGRLLYSEIHRQRVSSDGATVQTATYFDADNASIAERTVRFQGIGSAPTFHFVDLRRRSEQGVRVEGADLVAFRKVPGRSEFEERRLAPASDLITGPGFDWLVKSSWVRLESGETVAAEMLVPERLRTIRFELSMVGEGSLWDEPVVTFRMRFSNPLIRLVAGPIDVIYHRDFRVIMRYEGMSNIKDPKGGNFQAVIDYPPGDRTDRWSDAGALDIHDEAR